MVLQCIVTLQIIIIIVKNEPNDKITLLQHPQSNSSTTSEYLLGSLPSLLNASLSVLNPKFLHPEQTAQLRHLLAAADNNNNNGHVAPLPYIFVGLDTDEDDWRLNYDKLWNITTRAQREHN